MNDSTRQADTEPYHTIEDFGEDEHIVDRSRFIGRALPVDSEDEALAYVDEVKKEHYDARHVCYGLRVGRGSQTVDRCNDDGEPPRTAGLPIWQVLEGREVTDALVVVIRYYGGVQLGTGGLSRAYRQAARLAIDAAGVVERFPEEEVELHLPYELYGSVEHLVGQLDSVRQIDADFGAEITLKLAVYRRDIERVRTQLSGLMHCDSKEVFE